MTLSPFTIYLPDFNFVARESHMTRQLVPWPVFAEVTPDLREPKIESHMIICWLVISILQETVTKNLPTQSNICSFSHLWLVPFHLSAKADHPELPSNSNKILWNSMLATVSSFCSRGQIMNNMKDSDDSRQLPPHSPSPAYLLSSCEGQKVEKTGWVPESAGKGWWGCTRVEDAYYCCLCAGYSSEEIRSLVLPVAPLHPLLHPLHLFKHFSLVFLSFLARLLMKRMMGMPGEWWCSSRLLWYAPDTRQRKLGVSCSLSHPCTPCRTPAPFFLFRICDFFNFEF